jgi:hypothetical protein
MIEKDRSRVSSRFGSMEVGGEAQLEAIAYLAQMRIVQIYGGLDGIDLFQDSVYNLDRFADKYVSLVEAAAKLGLVPFEALDNGRVVVDTSIIECMIFAALQADYLPTSVSPGAGFVESSYPGDRFAALGLQLKRDHPEIHKMALGTASFDEALKLVDQACAKVFGYSIADQIEADVTYFERQFEEKIAGNVPDDIETIGRDFLSLRHRLLQTIRDSPEEIVSTERFVLSTADKIEPNYVICSSNGVIGDPPSGYNHLMGYLDKERDPKDYPYLKWWWACSPQKVTEATSTITLQNPKSWYSCMDFYAPLAKLFMNGRRIRTMLGPELMFAEQRLKAEYAIQTEIFPSFAFPEETFDPEVYYFYYGQDTLKCDFSSTPIHRPAGKVLTPWTLRRWPALAKRVIEQMGGHDVAYYTFVRDWSPWVVTDEIFEDLQNAMS